MQIWVCNNVVFATYSGYFCSHVSTQLPDLNKIKVKLRLKESYHQRYVFLIKTKVCREVRTSLIHCAVCELKYLFRKNDYFENYYDNVNVTLTLVVLVLAVATVISASHI